MKNSFAKLQENAESPEAPDDVAGLSADGILAVAEHTVSTVFWFSLCVYFRVCLSSIGSDQVHSNLRVSRELLLPSNEI